MRNIAKEPPVEKIRDMKIEGLSDDDIISALRPNYSNQDINDAMNQSGQDIPDDNPLEELDKMHPNLPGPPSAPSYPMQSEPEEPEELLEEAPVPESYGGEEIPQTADYPSYGVQSNMSSDQMQQIIEAVVEEKWEDMTSRVGDLNLWKETINSDLESIKQEILRTQERVNNLQNIMVGKVTEYSKSVSNTSTEMKALEQVIQRILQPLTTNIKDLNKVTSELKQHKHRSAAHATHITHKHKKKR